VSEANYERSETGIRDIYLSIIYLIFIKSNNILL